MILTLEISASSVGPIETRRQAFGMEGGTIGRAPGSTWVLPHRTVSAQHAQISWRDGVFYIRDTSRNGICVNSPDSPVVPNRPYPLKDGDRLFIEPYEIRVLVDVESDPHLQSPFADTGDGSPFLDPFEPVQSPGRSEPVSRLPAVGPLSDAVGNDELDPLKFLEPVPRSTPVGPLERPQSPADDLLEAHYRPPAVVTDSRLADDDTGPIPQGYNPFAPDDGSRPHPVPPVIRPRPGRDSGMRRHSSPPVEEGPKEALAPPPAAVRAPAPPDLPREAPRILPEQGAEVGLAELLKGAGISEAVISPQLANTLGSIIRTVVVGLMDVLQSRQQLKQEFNMYQTLFRPQGNNPLKFSANVEDALYNLLVKRNPAYLNPVDAFADAFDDLRDHQLAMLAGMRAAFEAMLAEFGATHLQQEFERQLGKSALPLGLTKLRYWDLYRERLGEMEKDPEACFSRLFGESFKRAYDEQFRQLKAQRSSRSADDRSASREP